MILLSTSFASKFVSRQTQLALDLPKGKQVGVAEISWEVESSASHFQRLLIAID